MLIRSRRTQTTVNGRSIRTRERFLIWPIQWIESTSWLEVDGGQDRPSVELCLLRPEGEPIFRFDLILCELVVLGRSIFTEFNFSLKYKISLYKNNPRTQCNPRMTHCWLQWLTHQYSPNDSCFENTSWIDFCKVSRLFFSSRFFWKMKSVFKNDEKGDQKSKFRK